MAKTRWYAKLVYLVVALALVLSVGITALPVAGTAQPSCYQNVWVDDSWNSQADVNLFDPSLTWQVDAFNTIQEGVDAVCEGGTVHVLPGNYDGGIGVNKANVIIKSTDGAEVTVVDPAACDGFEVTEAGVPIGGDNGFVVTEPCVTIDGFKITGFGGVESPSPGGSGDSLQSIPWSGCGIVLTGYVTADNCTIKNNIIENNWHGIWIETDNNQILYNNILNNIAVPPSGIHIGSYASGNEIHCNNIEGNSPYGVFKEGWDNCYGVSNEGGGNVDATNNWWGDPSGPSHSPGIGDKVSDNVDYNPWLPTQFEYCEECVGAAPAPMVPAMNHWGVVAMITLFAGLLVWTVRRRRVVS